MHRDCVRSGHLLVMSTTKTTIASLSVLTLLVIVFVSRHQLTTSIKRQPRTVYPLQADLLVSNRTTELETVNPAAKRVNISKDVIPTFDEVGLLNFTAPDTFTNWSWKPAQAHVECGHFQFRYVINPAETCATSKHRLRRSPVFLLSYVHSAVDNFARRARVRASWARASNYPNDRVETVFFIGLPTGDKRLTTQANVEAESRRFGDLVQIDVNDAYRYAMHGNGFTFLVIFFNFSVVR